MLHTILPLIISHVVPLGALGVFIAAFIDETVPIVPASVVLLSCGFLFLHGPLSWHLIEQLFTIIAMPAAIGLTLGSMIIYTISYIGGRPLLEHWGKWIGISWDDVMRLNQKLAQTNLDEEGILLAWIVPVIPSGLLAVFGGVTRIKPVKYALLTLTGTFFKSIIMGIIGWQAGVLYIKYADTIDRFEKLIFTVVALAIIGFIIYRKKLQKRSQNDIKTL